MQTFQRLILGLAYLAPLFYWSTVVEAKEFQVNCCRSANAPDWLSQDQVSDIANRVERKLSWDIRRVQLFFYPSKESLRRESHLSFSVRAFFRKKDQTVHLGPDVTAATLSEILGHELVHVIVSQKYKEAIPKWLDEGLANHLGSEVKVDYKWLKTQTIGDVTALVHPNMDSSNTRYHYQLSTAALEMIASRCNLNDLLMLSVGRSLESYLKTFCRIEDVNKAVRDWVANQGKPPM